MIRWWGKKKNSKKTEILTNLSFTFYMKHSVKFSWKTSLIGWKNFKKKLKLQQSGCKRLEAPSASGFIFINSVHIPHFILTKYPPSSTQTFSKSLFKWTKRFSLRFCSEFWTLPHHCFVDLDVRTRYDAEKKNKSLFIFSFQEDTWRFLLLTDLFKIVHNFINLFRSLSFIWEKVITEHDATTTMFHCEWMGFCKIWHRSLSLDFIIDNKSHFCKMFCDFANN